MKRLAFLLVLVCAGPLWGDIQIGSGCGASVHYGYEPPDMRGVERELRGIAFELEMQRMFPPRSGGGGAGYIAPPKKHSWKDLPTSAWAPGARERAFKQAARVKRAEMLREKKAAKREKARAK